MGKIKWGRLKIMLSLLDVIDNMEFRVQSQQLNLWFPRAVKNIGGNLSITVHCAKVVNL